MPTERELGLGAVELFDMLPDPMWIFDRATLHVLEANLAASRVFGYSRSQLLRKSILDLRPVDDAHAIRDAMANLADGETAGGVWRIVTASGEIRHVDFHWRTIIFKARPSVLASARDVTELVAAQQEKSQLLEETQRLRSAAEQAAVHFRSLFEAVPGKFLVLEPGQYEIVAVSDAYLAATMRRREEIKGKPLFEAFPDDPGENTADGVRNLKASLDRVRDTGFTDQMAVQRYPIPRPAEQGGGFEERYWNPVNTPVFGPDGELSFIIHRVEDVTELVQSGALVAGRPAIAQGDASGTAALDIVLRSQELKLANTRLKEQETNLRMAKRLLNLGIWKLDCSSGALTWSDTMFNMLGLDRSTFQPTIQAYLNMVHPEDQDATRAFVEHMKQPEAPTRAFEHRLIDTKGSIIYVRGSAEQTQTPDGLQVVGVMQNITERRDLEARLRQAQKLEAVGHLTGGIAHDFNNILTVILGNSELLIDMLQDQPDLLSMAQMTASAAERGAQLTNRLLAFARRQALEPKPVNLNQVLAGMDGLLRRVLSEDIELELVQSAGMGVIEVDPGQLETAVLNLVINARDAMQKKGGRLTIETGRAHLDTDYVLHNPEASTGDYLFLSVSDTGCGMTPDVQARAFEPFFTTKEVGKGSGLGLSMVYGFVRQSGGYAKIYSEPGEGTSVKLYFPAASAAVGQVCVKPDQPTFMVGGTEHILVVEDDKPVQQNLVAQLKDLGYRVSVADNGPQALELLASLPDVDLLFTDIIMPAGMNGRELAEQAQTMRPGLRVLFSSGYTNNALVHQGRLDHGVQLLGKPYHRQELATKVRSVLDTPPEDTKR